jgi:MoaA/NifB/PqqE/SkfB family radical SAM enzyme
MVKPVFADGEARNDGGMFLTADSYRDLQYELVDHSIGRETLLELPQPVYINPADVPMSANVKLWERCSCAFESVYLSPVGDIWPCNYSAGDPQSREQILGNIRDEEFDFDAMWRSPSSWPAYRQPAKGTCCVSQSLGAATLDDTGRPELVTVSSSYPCV